MIVIMGLVYAVIYYFLFRFLIVKFDFKTPGREDDDVDAFAAAQAPPLSPRARALRSRPGAERCGCQDVGAGTSRAGAERVMRSAPALCLVLSPTQAAVLRGYWWFVLSAAWALATRSVSSRFSRTIRRSAAGA